MRTNVEGWLVRLLGLNGVPKEVELEDSVDGRSSVAAPSVHSRCCQGTKATQKKEEEKKNETKNQASQRKGFYFLIMRRKNERQRRRKVKEEGRRGLMIRVDQ